ncbi:complement C1q-like protein 3, partial [Saccostrea cucullata]|uniref:complement C1q-like protein 3 n=1 Tax=Saccostrea cuccullata TaxID=36930 RepID=UPI002ED28571
TCAEAIAFHADFKRHLRNVPVNTIIKFDNVQLNKGKGYDPKTGVFTAPEDGLYSFDWLSMSTRGASLYLCVVVDHDCRVGTCIDKQQSGSTTGHFVTDLKKGSRVWIRVAYRNAQLINGALYNYFSGFKIN